MQTYRLHALVLGSAVTSQVMAGGVAEAVNAFVSSARVTRIKAIDEPAANGLKQFEIAIKINGEEFTKTVSSNDIYGPLYQQATSNVIVTGVEEVDPADVNAAGAGGPMLFSAPLAASAVMGKGIQAGEITAGSISSKKS